MTKLCRQYLSDVKTLFPIMGKPEKQYLAKLAISVDDYCLEEQATTVEELYKGFGKPTEVVNNYFMTIEPPQIIGRIRLSQWIKRAIATFLLVALIGVSIYAISTYKAYKIFVEEQAFGEETEITD